MSCSPFDLKDYLLQELDNPKQRLVEAHVQTCPSCRTELDRLRLTRTALSSLVEEEIPQRIGFVSDKIFEPSPWRRWVAAFWASPARLGFASVAMLSVALVVSPMIRPGRPSPQPVTASTISDSEIRQRIEAGVTRAVADIEARYSQRTEQLVKDLERRDQEERATIQKTAAVDVDYWRRRSQAAEISQYRAANRDGEPQ